MAMLPKYIPQSLKYNLDSASDIQSSWSWFHEPVGISKTQAFVKPGLLEQINTTGDKSDYLWYSSRYIQVLYFFETHIPLLASSVAFDVFIVLTLCLDREKWRQRRGRDMEGWSIRCLDNKKGGRDLEGRGLEGNMDKFCKKYDLF